jgi:leader peptidase (prepilin peptidase)/N-methyltransferase
VRWYDNIPLLSFVLLKFRCRDCGEKISWQYPLVEFSTGLLFALVSFQFFNLNDPATFFPTFFYLGIVSSFVVIFAYDVLYFEIPGLVLWPSIGWIIVYNLFMDWGNSGVSSDVFRVATYSGTLAAFVAFLFFFLLSSLSREKWMGMGDAFLVIFLGLIVGWPQILLALFLAFAIGAVYGIILIVLKKKKMKSQLPFAPFLILGTLVTIFGYTPVVGWYLGLFKF